MITNSVHRVEHFRVVRLEAVLLIERHRRHNPERDADPQHRSRAPSLIAFYMSGKVREKRNRGRKSGPPGQEIRPDFPRNLKHLKQPKFPHSKTGTSARVKTIRNAQRRSYPAQYTHEKYASARRRASSYLKNSLQAHLFLWARTEFLILQSTTEVAILQSRKSRVDVGVTTG